MGNKGLQFAVNILPALLIFFLWSGLLISIPYDGHMYFDFNRIGELWFEFWLMPITVILLLIYAFKQYID